MTIAPPLAPGLHPHMPLADYLALDCASASRLYTLAHKSPWHVVNGERATSTAMSMGSLLHALVLEPETVPDRFYRFEGEKRSNMKKAEWADAEDRGMEVVREAAWDAAIEQAETVRAAVAHLVPTIEHVEATLVWTDSDTGLACKARPDILTRVGIITDIKRVVSGHPLAFLSACRRYGAHWQAGWYRRAARAVGIPYTEWQWVTCEYGKSGACGPITTYTARDEDLDLIDVEMNRALARYAECRRKGEWPAYEGGELALSSILGDAVSYDDEVVIEED